MALPISLGGNTNVIIAIPVTNIIELPIPCNTLAKIKKYAEGDRAARNVDIVKKIIPNYVNLFHSIDICKFSKRNC
jgi:hypothetical protein